MSITFQSSVIFVKDIAASRRFYEDLLGQKVLFDFGENVSFEKGLAIHDANHISQLLFERPAQNIDQLGRENFELYFEAEDLDVVLGRLSDASVEFVHPLREQPWGQRVVRFYDPDKNIIEVGESLEFLSYRLSKEGNLETYF